MTQQDIVDGLGLLNQQFIDGVSVLKANLKTDQKVLQDACGEMGHSYDMNGVINAFRFCVICQCFVVSMPTEAKAGV